MWAFAAHPLYRGRNVFFETLQLLEDFVLEPKERKIFAVVSPLQNPLEIEYILGRCMEEKTCRKIKLRCLELPACC